jgi:hypothetical protein
MYPVIKTWQVALRARSTTKIDEAGRAHAPRALELAARIRCCRPKTGRARLQVQCGGPISSEVSALPLPTRRTGTYQASSGRVSITGSLPVLASRFYWNRSDFYDLFRPPEEPQGCRQAGYGWSLIYDEPRRLDLLLDLATTIRSTRCKCPKRSPEFHRLLVGSRVAYSDVQQSIGRSTTKRNPVGVAYSDSRVKDHITSGSRGARSRFSASRRFFGLAAECRGRDQWRPSTPSPASIWRSAATTWTTSSSSVTANTFVPGLG